MALFSKKWTEEWAISFLVSSHKDSLILIIHSYSAYDLWDIIETLPCVHVLFLFTFASIILHSLFPGTQWCSSLCSPTIDEEEGRMKSMFYVNWLLFTWSELKGIRNITDLNIITFHHQLMCKSSCNSKFFLI